MIEAENLTKYYGSKPAIREVSFQVKKGEILGLLGPNAAGKTTTMRILTGFLPPSSGTARVAGYDVLEQSMEVRRRIGYLPETVPLYPDMAVRDYLDFMARIKGVPNKRRPNRVTEVMEIAHVQNVADTLIGRISKGYRQRVGLAQALLHDPEVLILDEPTIGLDPRQIVETRQVIKGLGGDHTVMLSTHILPEVSMTCNRVVIINEGRVVAVDTPENLTTRLRGSETIQVEVCGPWGQVVGKIKEMPQVLHVDHQPQGDDRGTYRVECALGSDLRAGLAAVIVGNGWGLLELRAMGMSMEEIYLKLVTKEVSLE